MRALRRAGERRFALSTNALTKAGLVGSFASMLAVNTFLRLVGLELVAKRSSSSVLIQILCFNTDTSFAGQKYSLFNSLLELTLNVPFHIGINCQNIFCML